MASLIGDDNFHGDIILLLLFLQNRIKYSEDMYEVPCLAKAAHSNEKVGSGTFLCPTKCRNIRLDCFVTNYFSFLILLILAISSWCVDAVCENRAGALLSL